MYAEVLRDFTKDSFDIIIQGGQSNSEGFGYGPVEQPFEPRPEILMMDGDFIIYTACEKVWGNQPGGNLSLTFADEYIK